MSEGYALRVARDFANVSEQQIAELEYQVEVTALDSLEFHLLYALRVFKCVPDLRKLDTLASRWGVAHRGAGGMGLDAAKSSPDWSTIVDFLTKLYQDKFRELAQQTVTKTIENEPNGKATPRSRKSLTKELLR